MQLNGKRVLVTGGTSGVGRALVTALLDRGASVATCGRDIAALEALAARSVTVGTGPGRLPERLARTGSAQGFAADLSLPGEASRVVRLAVESLGGLDVVIANAAVQRTTVLTDGPSPELFASVEEEIAVNLRSVVELAATAWPYLRANPAASFVAVSSGLGFVPKRSAPVYCATKAAVHIMLESLRYQAKATTPTVRVQEAVLPLVDTPMTAGREGPARKISASAAAEAILRGIERETDLMAIGATRALLALLRIAPPVAKRILRDG